MEDDDIRYLQDENWSDMDDADGALHHGLTEAQRPQSHDEAVRTSQDNNVFGPAQSQEQLATFSNQVPEHQQEGLDLPINHGAEITRVVYPSLPPKAASTCLLEEAIDRAELQNLQITLKKLCEYFSEPDKAIVQRWLEFPELDGASPTASKKRKLSSTDHEDSENSEDIEDIEGSDGSEESEESQQSEVQCETCGDYFKAKENELGACETHEGKQKVVFIVNYGAADAEHKFIFQASLNLTMMPLRSCKPTKLTKKMA